MEQPSAQEASENRVTIFLRNLVFGGLSTSISYILCAPLERTLLMTMKPMFESTLKLVRDAGFLNLYLGVGTKIVGSAPYQALSFALYHYGKDLLVRSNASTHPWSYIRECMLTGVLTGLPVHGLFLGYAAIRNRRFKSLAEPESRRVFYRMLPVYVLGVAVFRSLFMPGYDASKLLHKNKQQHIVRRYIHAEIVSFIALSASTTIDHVRQHLSRAPNQFSGFIDCVLKVFERDGVRGFTTRNFGVTRRSFGHAARLVIFDELHTFFKTAKGSAYH
jgi:hypothetical protein